MPVACRRAIPAHDGILTRVMTAPRDHPRRADTVELLPLKSPKDPDLVELLPLKSALVNNNYHDEEAYYPPPPVFSNPSSSNLYDYTLLSKRTPASKKLLARTTQPAPTPLLTLCGAPPPSRKREELAALANLRKKVSPAMLKADKYTTRNNNNDSSSKEEEEPLDNRPKLLQRVLQSRPVSMVVQWSEVRTAWQDSDFITDCLCWHNVYRQRHGAPQLYMAPEVLQSRPVSMVVQWSEVRTAWQDSDFITDCLCWHNVYRQRHGAPQLYMAPELCDYAQAWANHLAHTNKFRYRNDRDVGQNLYQRPVTALQPEVTGQEVSSYWYAAVRQYSFFKEADVLHANVNAGHFTQMVWVATRFFGVGKARSRAGKVIVVANYSPPGNISGQFEANVLPPLPENFPDLPPPPEH